MNNKEDITSESFLSQLLNWSFCFCLMKSYLGEEKSFVIIFGLTQNNSFLP